ncbi:hypothetical protein [Caballeronia sp. J97]|uniref:hypothetical protein n=1 Tax=Caballeronia sp. J97 TaxID=2805429 RepID=UPI002AB1E7C0|nr:hypothetical protein [Caballeronia sp. J97]
MRFFQRLAPGARTQNAVRPVLTPRGMEPHATLPDADTERSMPPLRAIAPAGAPDSPAPDRMAAERETPPSDSVAAHAPRSVAPIPTRPQHDDPPAQPRTASRPYTVTGVMHAGEPAVEPMPAPVSGATPPARAAHTRAPAAPAPERPLSAAALAQRMLPAAREATVVHVTIDRIDVRAPAATPAPRPQAKPRATPAMSLADYLRRGTS